MQGIKLFIMIRDADSYCSYTFFGFESQCNHDCFCQESLCSQLVEILQINHDQPVGMTLQRNYTGIYEFVTMNLTITVFCEDKYYLKDQSAHRVWLVLLGQTVMTYIHIYI